MTDQTTQSQRHKNAQTFQDRLNKFIHDDGLTVLIVIVLVMAYALLRTTGDTFESVEIFRASIDNSQPTVIEFYSNNCSICLTSKPKVAQLERDLHDVAQVLKLNVKDPVNQSLASEWGVRGVPTFFVLDPDGTILYTRAGGPDIQAISQVVYDITSENTNVE